MSRPIFFVLLAIAVFLGGIGAFWLASKLPTLLAHGGFRVGFDTILLAYATFTTGAAGAIAACFLAGSTSKRRTVAARCVAAINVSLLILWVVLHFSGTVFRYEAKPQASLCLAEKSGIKTLIANGAPTLHTASNHH